MKKIILSAAIATILNVGVTTTASAELANNAVLNFDPGVLTSNAYGSVFL